jgi:hypothetical protein
MADPVVIDCPSTCTVTVVHELALPPLQLDTEDAAQVAGAVLLVWATGYAFRALIRALNVDRKEDTDSE